MVLAGSCCSCSGRTLPVVVGCSAVHHDAPESSCHRDCYYCCLVVVVGRTAWESAAVFVVEVVEEVAVSAVAGEVAAVDDDSSAVRYHHRRHYCYHGNYCCSCHGDSMVVDLRAGSAIVSGNVSDGCCSCASFRGEEGCSLEDSLPLYHRTKDSE